MNKAPKRSSRGYRLRVRPTREIRQRFLIVCEGEKTEPNYFRIYSKLAAVIEIDIRPAAGDPLGVVKRAELEVDKERFRLGERKSFKPYDQVWCVFDRDDVPKVRFNQALILAQQLGYRVAYSNQAFELWYILHFEFLNSAITRAAYLTKLNSMFPGGYAKNAINTFNRLRDKQTIAIQNAHRLLAEYIPSVPCDNNPSTTVHHLIIELNRFLI